MVNEGLIKADRDGREIVTYEDIRDSALWKRMGEDEGKHTNEEDQRRVALHEAAHAVGAHYWYTRTRIQFASVAKRGRTGGMVTSTPIEERMGQVKSQMEASIKVSLASRWAEIEYFGDLSTGHHCASHMCAGRGRGARLRLHICVRDLKIGGL